MADSQAARIIELQEVIEAMRHTKLPTTPEEVRSFIGGRFVSLHYGHTLGQPHDDDCYTITAHDLIRSVKWWADLWAQPEQPAQEPGCEARIQTGPFKAEPVVRVGNEAQTEQPRAELEVWGIESRHEPLAYAIFTESGHIRLWSKEPQHVKRIALEQGVPFVELCACQSHKPQPLTAAQAMEIVRDSHDCLDAIRRTEAAHGIKEGSATPQPKPAKFQIGEQVRKTKGSQWHGHVVGTYSTEYTPEGYAVESIHEKGSVQIYPAAALEREEDA